jgi:predicted RNA-binding protein YlqC (UPF0109 family)
MDRSATHTRQGFPRQVSRRERFEAKGGLANMSFAPPGLSGIWTQSPDTKSTLPFIHTTQAASQAFGLGHLALDDEDDSKVEARQAKTSSVHPATAGIGLGGGIWSMYNTAEFCPPIAPFASSYLSHTAADFRPVSSSFHLHRTAAKTSCSTFSGSEPVYVSNKTHRDKPPIFPLSSYLEGNFASPIPDDMLYVPQSQVMLPSVLPLASHATTTRKHKPSTITTRILLPAFCAGCIIGRGGDVIKGIRDFSGAYITILESGSDNRNSNYRLVTLVGPLQAVATAIQMIGLQAGLFDNDLPVGQDGHSQITSRGSGLHDHHPSMTPQSFLPAFPSRVSQPLYSRMASQEKEAETVGASGAGEDMDLGICMVVDGVMLGQLMGRRGRRIDEIRTQTGVRRIQVLSASESQQEGVIRQERIVVILGTAEQCRRAHQDITLVLEADPLSLQQWEELRGLGGLENEDCPIDSNVVGLETALSLMEGLAPFQRMSLVEREQKKEYCNGQDRVGAGWDRELHTQVAGEKQEKDEGNEEDKGHDELSETLSGLIAPKAKIVSTAKSLGAGATGAGNVSRVAAGESEAFSAFAMSAGLLSSIPLAEATTGKSLANTTAASSPPSFVSLPPPAWPLSSASSSTSSFSSPAPSVDDCGSTSLESLVAADAKKSFREFSAEVVVRISNENIGRLIGKEGSTIRRLRHESQCRIEIDDYRHPTDCTMREVRIKGHIQQVHVAAGMVAQQLFRPEDGVWY